jgi:KTSC domain
MASSVIRDWHYDAREARLDVTFTSGRRYRYHGVPPWVAQGWMLPNRAAAITAG